MGPPKPAVHRETGSSRAGACSLLGTLQTQLSPSTLPLQALQGSKMCGHRLLALWPSDSPSPSSPSSPSPWASLSSPLFSPSGLTGVQLPPPPWVTTCQDLFPTHILGSQEGHALCHLARELEQVTQLQQPPLLVWVWCGERY